MRASFFTRVEHRASARAPSRAAPARASTSRLTSMDPATSFVMVSENHQVVAVDDFVHATVPQSLLDLPGLGAPDLAQLGGVEVHEAAADFPAVGLGDDRHHFAGGEVAADVDNAR